MKILAVDVAYRTDTAVAAGVLFGNWEDNRSSKNFTTEISAIASYIPGQFYKRELPCILGLLEQHEIHPDCIVVDGLVYLDGVGKAGLGKYLFDALEGNTAVIGVAKNSYKNISSDFALCRGKSKKPLFVTSAGVDIAVAKKRIANMHGNFRLPTLLKQVDRLCRAGLGFRRTAGTLAGT